MFATAAAVAAGSGATVLAGETPQGRSANERLGVAVMGVRGRGGSHISAFAGRRDTEILYVCDVDAAVGQKRAKEIEKRQGRVPAVEQDLRRVLEDTRVDIVSIATPNHWHSLAAIWSMQAGKDVYVEKPISHNVSEGRRVVEAAEKYRRICQTGTQCRSNSGMIAAMDFLHAGGIGRVKVARGLCYKRRGSIGPRGVYEPPAGVDYGLWLGPAPVAPLARPQFHYDWHWQWPYGNGDLGNQGIHQMDIARWGLGVNELCQGVLSYGGRFGYEDAGDTANTQIVIHEYADAALVFEVRGLSTDAYRDAKVGVIFEGTEGYLVVTSYSSGAAFDLDGKKVSEFQGGGDHFENFLKAVRSRKGGDLNANALEGHLSSALCHLGNISYQLGEPVRAADLAQRLDGLTTTDDAKDTLERTLSHLRANKLGSDALQITLGPHLKFDPKAETIPGNDVANRLLTRDYREPFTVPPAGQV